jgi:hypothetical protein
MKKHFTEVLLPSINVRQKDFISEDGSIPRAIVFLGIVLT